MNKNVDCDDLTSLQNTSTNGDMIIGLSGVDHGIETQFQRDAIPEEKLEVDYFNRDEPDRKLDLESDGKISVTHFVENALPGKTLQQIQAVVSTLNKLEINCSKDLEHLANGQWENSRDLAKWLETNSGLLDSTCVRLASYLFSEKRK